MPEIVRISSPIDMHAREDVLTVNVLESGDRRFEDIPLLLENLRILIPVKILDPRFDGHARGGLTGIFLSENRHRLFLDVRQRRIDLLHQHHFIDGRTGHLEDVRGTVVTVDAIHRAHRQLGKLFRRVL